MDIEMGACFEFDLPNGMSLDKWKETAGIYDVMCDDSDARLRIEGVWPDMTHMAKPVVEAEQFRHRKEHIRSWIRDQKWLVTKPYAREPKVRVPCWTIECRTADREVFCAAIARNRGGVLEITLEATSEPGALRAFRRLVRAIRAPRLVTSLPKGRPPSGARRG